MGNPVVPPVASPSLLTRLAGSFFSASGGTVTLKLTDNAGDTVFDCAQCVLNDTTNRPSTPMPVACVAPAKQISFRLVAGQKYRLQLVFIQVPTLDSSADLTESPCGQLLDTIDATNQIQTWNIQA